MSNEIGDVRRELDNWKDALLEAQKENNSFYVVRLYARDAVLLSTLLISPKVGHVEILDYFDNHFLNKHPVVVDVSDEKIQIFGDVAIISGLYDFDVDASPGEKRSRLRARYTFVYKKITDNNWIIVAHHSSAAPETDETKLATPQYFA